MKWPEWLLIVRHAQSSYNILKDAKRADEAYQRFSKFYELDPENTETKRLAELVNRQFAMNISDAETPLVDLDLSDAIKVGESLKSSLKLPDVICVSPYLRTTSTLEGLIKGWPELAEVKVYQDERLVEQDHGLMSLYNDWRVFFALNPEQRRLYELQGNYRYRYPQGENVADVRERIRSWFNTIVRDFASRRVLVVTHHLALLSMRANLERWGETEFIRVDKDEKPINLGVTMYRGCPDAGSDGKLVLGYYNHKLY